MATVSPLFGGVLSGLFDSVNQTIQQSIESAENTGLNLEIEAGSQIAIAIENAKNGYQDCLNVTVDRVSKTAKETLDQLSAMVQTFQRHNAEEIKGLKATAQQLMNTLPLASKQPQLTSVSPQYLVIDKRPSYVVAFAGNFPWSAKVGFEPALSLNEKKCTLIKSTTQRLDFQVPAELIHNDQNYKYAFQLGQLQVPWDNGWVFSHKAEFDYKVGLSILPLSPGKIVVEYVSHQTDRVTQHTQTPEISVDGNSFGKTRWHNVIQAFYPSSGWQIDVTKTPALIAVHEHGIHSQEIIAVTPQQIQCKIGVHCGDGHDMGILHYHVNFDEFQMVPRETRRQEEVELKWGDSHVLEPKAGEEIARVIFDAYDGSHQEFGKPDLDRPFLKVSSEGEGKWKIWSEVPKE